MSESQGPDMSDLSEYEAHSVETRIPTLMNWWANPGDRKGNCESFWLGKSSISLKWYCPLFPGRKIGSWNADDISQFSIHPPPIFSSVQSL